jgi:two-component system alkaline phosphatase synthesis response regulator PhoP
MMAHESILVVEDEEHIQELVCLNLNKEGYRTVSAATGEEALVIARAQRPNLILLDLMLPGIDGLEVCKTLKAGDKTRSIPIVILTAKGEDADIVAGLELGADDYITKPFSPRVMIARVRAVLRRRSTAQAPDSAVIKIFDLTIDPGRHEVLVAERRVELTFTEFRILSVLARRPGWVFTRYQIVDAVHGEGYPVTDRSIDVQIAGLRKKLGEAGHFIQTIRGIGYRFREE